MHTLRCFCKAFHPLLSFLHQLIGDAVAQKALKEATTSHTKPPTPPAASPADLQRVSMNSINFLTSPSTSSKLILPNTTAQAGPQGEALTTQGHQAKPAALTCAFHTLQANLSLPTPNCHIHPDQLWHHQKRFGCPYPPLCMPNSVITWTPRRKLLRSHWHVSLGDLRGVETTS